jgi:putative Ca2+/H+ antiporter (TMEM165/GDT1 family)
MLFVLLLSFKTSYLSQLLGERGDFMSGLITVFFSVFLAELGDKTQIATLLFATNSKLSPFMIFLASAGALVLSSAIAVLAGTLAKTYLQNIPLKFIAGVAFILIGVWTLYEFYKG